MADYKVTDSELTGIANAIRTKGGTSSQLVFPDGFTSAIGAIPTGGGSTLITKNITQNGTYDAEDDNADGYSSVVVDVSSGGGIPLLTRDEWNALTRAQKKEYGLVAVQDSSSSYEAGILYIGSLVGPVALIPKMTSVDLPYGSASASSYFVGYTSAWRAFDQVPTASTMANGWLPESSDATPWLMYEFRAGLNVSLSSITITTADNGNGAQKTVYIEGRVNGAWQNLLYGKESEVLTFNTGSYGDTAVKHEFELNDTLIDAIRLRFTENLYGTGGIACTIDEMQVYGESVIVSS